VPIYIFECNKCKNNFEVYQKNIKDSFNYTCPKCKNSDVKKVMTPTSFILKGSGWARDNYTSKKS